MTDTRRKADLEALSMLQEKLGPFQNARTDNGISSLSWEDVPEKFYSYVHEVMGCYWMTTIIVKATSPRHVSVTLQFE